MHPVLKRVVKHVADKLNGKVPSGKKRSPEWPALEKSWLVDNPTCAVCDGKERLNVHHVVPFHLDPAKELDRTNLITLCESGHHGINCNLLVGHRGNFQKENPDVRADAAAWRAKLKAS